MKSAEERIWVKLKLLFKTSLKRKMKRRKSNFAAFKQTQNLNLYLLRREVKEFGSKSSL
jgi:hypothetical protein